MNRKRNLRLVTAASIFEQGKHRAVIVEFTPANPDLVTLRLSGLRSAYPVDLGRVFCWVQERAIEAERRAKARAKAEARKARASI